MPKTIIFQPGQTRDIPLPPPDTKVIILAPAPAPQEPKLPIARLLVTPLLMAGAYVVIVLLGIFRSEYLIFMLLMALIFPVQGYVEYRLQIKENRQENERREQAHREQLEKARQRLDKMHNDVRQAIIYVHPIQAECLKIVSERLRSRLWARRPGNDSFLQLRLGTGKVPFSYEIVAPEQHSTANPDFLLDEARRVAEEYRMMHRMPVTLPIAQTSVAGIVGTSEEALKTIFTLVVQLTTHHAPHDVKLVLVYPKEQKDQWELLRWLPHVWSDDYAQRFLACDREPTRKMLDIVHEEIKERQGLVAQDADNHRITFLPHYVFVFADEKLVKGHPIRGLLYSANSRLRTTALILTQRSDTLPPECQVTIRLSNKRSTISFRGVEPIEYDNREDLIPESILDQFCRSLAPVRIKHDTIAAEIPNMVSLFDVLGIRDIKKMSLLRRWTYRNPFVSMSAPVGQRAGGQIQYLDLHERKGKPTLKEGHGPHGLIAGTTGSGKTELIQTLILSLAAHFHPHEVVFAIVDFRPPAVDPIIYELPHVVNVIDKSEQDYVPRALSSLEAELGRRVSMFREAGVNHVDDYMDLYRAKDQSATQPMPYLIVIVDEFAELREKLPDEMARFETIARQGRAYGVRMILATQKPAGKITGEVVSNVSLRLCLRVATAADSEDMIDTDLASRLKYPGRTYFRLAGEEGEPSLFQSAYPAARYVIDQDNSSPARILLDGNREKLLMPDSPAPEQPLRQIDVLVNHITQESSRNNIHRLDGPWRNPLPHILPDRFHFGDYQMEGSEKEIPDQERKIVKLMEQFRSESSGWDGNQWRPTARWLMPLIGLCDDPAQQAQPPLSPDLGQKGHLLIICGTDKPFAVSRQVLRTMVFSLVQDHPPSELHLYCLDFGNNSLRIFEGLPHVGNVVRLGQVRLLKRLLVWLLREIESRKQWLENKKFDSLTEARTQGVDDVLPAIVLLIDNLEAVRQEETRLNEIEEQTINNLAKIAADGFEVGIHLVVAGSRNLIASKGFDFRPLLDRMQDMRLYLQLGQQNAREKQNDYAEIIDGIRKDLYIPSGVEGRGVFMDATTILECQVAQVDVDTDKLKLFASKMQTASNLLQYLPVRQVGNVLPTKVKLSEILELNSKSARLEVTPFTVPIGIADSTLEPIDINLDIDGPHFIVTGPRYAGKTSALISWLTALAATHSPQQIEFALFDTFKRSLAPLQGLPHNRHYALLGTETAATALTELRELLRSRREASTPVSEPRLIVVCEDYTGDNDEVFRQFLTKHFQRDVPVGLHIILSLSIAERMANHYDDPRKRIVSSSPSGLLVGSQNISDDAGIFDNMLLPYNIEPRSLLPGQAYLFRHRRHELVQLAMVPPTELEKWLLQIRRRFSRVDSGDEK